MVYLPEELDKLCNETTSLGISKWHPKAARNSKVTKVLDKNQMGNKLMINKTNGLQAGETIIYRNSLNVTQG